MTNTDMTILSLFRQSPPAAKFEPSETHRINLHLSTIVDKIVSLEKLRTSKDVIRLLQEIIDDCVTDFLGECWGIQSIKPRLDAMMKLAVPFLCTPIMTSMLNIGESLSFTSGTLDRTKKCMVDIFTFFINFELFHVHRGEAEGENGTCDSRRVELCIALLSSKCSKYSPLAVTIKEYAHPLLLGLSCHALGVTALCDDITEAISILVHHLGLVVLGDASPSLASPASDVFSTDIVAIQKTVLETLCPYISDFFVWLESHRKIFIRVCRSLEVVECVNPALRRSLQNEEFCSPSDILKKYHEKYRTHLTLMPLPVQVFQREDVVQATKDINRENFTLNCMHHHGSRIVMELMPCLRTAFLLFKSRDSCLALMRKKERIVLKPTKESSQKELTTVHIVVNPTERCDLTCVMEQVCTENTSCRNKSFTSRPFTEFVELLFRFLLIASSRTLSSGDAFFILNDLFGGDGLTLSCQSRESKKSENDIEITVDPLHFSVECGQFYDLFSSIQVSQCKDRKSLIPIISFEIRVFTIFNFEEALRNFLELSALESGRKGSEQERELEFQNNLFSYLFIILSSDPEKVCQRSLNIIPKVE